MPKVAPGLSERMTPPLETLARAVRIAAAKGVTRVADITGLDRLAIPVFSAVVPKSDDTITVYNGKGVWPVDARVGALMESIERQTALSADAEIVEGSYARLRHCPAPAVDPRLFNHKLRDGYSDARPYQWMGGYDLLRREAVLVPAILAGFGRRFCGGGSPYEAYSSNGLASGNCLEEAVCHGLCELIERDAWTLAELRSRWLPRARREALFGADDGAAGLDDYDAYPRIDLSDAGWPIAELIEKFHRACLRPVVRDITSDFGVSCVIATAVDDCVPGFPQVHSGLGAHPTARIAVVRALTELAQSRAVDIQGVREDILPPEAMAPDHERHTQRIRTVEQDRWMLRGEGIERRFADVPSVENEDIAEDIGLILRGLEREGIDRVIVVDLSEPGGFSVVRVLVPGLEFWVLDRGKLGPRALRFWKRYAAAS